jgi:hydroxymethylglutaryl-CoA lyase
MNRFESPLATTLGNTILRDVTLRDGLQLTGKLLPTEQKIETVRELLRLGVPAIELGSMARADLVPTMANTLEVVRALTPEELEKVLDLGGNTGSRGQSVCRWCAEFPVLLVRLGFA